MNAPRTKGEFYRRYLAGEFGNRARDWSTPEEFDASGFEGRVGIRSLYRGGPCWYDVPAEDIRARRFPNGCDPRRANFSEMLPDQSLILQGEFAHWPECGRRLLYSRVRAPMRVALAQEQRFAMGAAALAVLRFAMWPTSYDDFVGLLERYPDAAIEFSAYEVAVGTVPHRNTVFWEIREY